MKMIILIVKDSLTEALTRALTSAQFRVTGIASTGGFLRSGVSTLLIGLEASQLESAIAVIRSTLAAPSAGPPKVLERQATLFVVPVSRFEQV
jgi:uncharacterized protein YaaQ